MSRRKLARDVAEESANGCLCAIVRRLLAKWEPRLGVKIKTVRTKRMSTYWASVTEADGRMWINPALAQQPPKFVEYVIVHELVHLLTDGHDAKFYALMDRHLPGWRRMHGERAGRMTQHN